MDYLREGINLRAMGQQDPLVAWQKEGFDMFGQLMSGIDDDYVKYVMHAEVVVEQPELELDKAQYAAADDPVQGSSAIHSAALAEAAASPDPESAMSAIAVADEPAPMAPVVRSEEEKTGRNQPCWCGSGKKYKMCHGR